ncbi:MAG: hypothetical protein JO263_01695 [Candidatus Eremiobacteraeota bacterium]|nr:hypothetical protein [Candidatus Eremiobacteraeota bacterium]
MAEIPYWWIADPGPEIYGILKELQGETQGQVARVIVEAQAQIFQTKSAAYQKIAAIIGGTQGRAG